MQPYPLFCNHKTHPFPKSSLHSQNIEICLTGYIPHLNLSLNIMCNLLRETQV